MNIFDNTRDYFQSNRYISNTSTFFQSNTLVSYIAFLLLLLIVFLTLLRIGINLIGWILSPSGNTKLINGMIDAKFSQHFSQNPNFKNSKPILRSINKHTGIEFTWSVWLFIEDLDYGVDQYKHIFHKGNDKLNYSVPPIGLNEPNNGPGLYISPNKNNLIVIMNTFEKINEEIVVTNVPLNKWINVIIRCKNKTIDVYINGRIKNRYTCQGVPFQNYGDVYTTLNGGFSGYLSNLWYWNKALTPTAIRSIVRRGPNLKMKNNQNLTNAKPSYFALRWFISNNEF